MRKVRVSAIDFASPIKGFEAFKSAIRMYLDKVQSSDIVVFPEYMNLGIIDHSMIPVSSWAEATKEYVYDLTNFLNAESMKRGQVIITGMMNAYHTPTTNAGFIFSPNGQYQIQDKTKIIHRETKWGCVAGKVDAPAFAPRVYDLGYTKVGINLCYEVEFPELTRKLVKDGIEILIVPSATFSEPGFDRVRVCCSARAIENQIFVVNACLQGLGLRGTSCILTPRDVDWPGRIGKQTEQGVTAELDLDRLQELRLSSSANTYKDFIGD